MLRSQAADQSQLVEAREEAEHLHQEKVELQREQVSESSCLRVVSVTVSLHLISCD